MAIRSIKNQYRGINAHLHSYWQAEGGWNGFHTAHIGDLFKALKARLWPMGYTADIEPSLQIRRLDERPTDPESDITVYDLDPKRSKVEFVSHAAEASVLVVPIPKLLAESPLSEKRFGAIAIYELTPRRSERGQPVAWIELLSPSNKGSSRDAEIYREKRLKILDSGIVFVEIDYLHETLPTFKGIVDYRPRKGKPATHDSHPYRIVILDPRPEVDEGEASLGEFDVDQPVPTIAIPLNAGDMLDFDFGTPYHKTFEEALYGLELVDYTQLPANFHRYSEEDQARIVARMLAVIEAAKRGEDLEKSIPSPLTPRPLQEGLTLLQALTV
jgi:hypothetical protein